ncbi:TIGR03032 family protein [Dokdonella sp.]|uniref:TIGR03032 family protein n=1 Tax=Dokdonella sp. TaxID=2291710 RepID=UPI003C4B4D4B
MSERPISPEVAASPSGAGVQMHASRLFVSWLAEQHASIAFTTYQGGKIFFVGVNANGELAIFNRNLARVMGVAVHEHTLWIATLWQLWRFENVLKPGERYGAYDRYYVPQLAYTTGDIDVHDVGVDADGDPIFISTLFSCIARPDPKYSFTPIWKPPFVSRYAAEDRCHLNGLAMRDGQAAYVSCVARSDANEGWREHRRTGGLIIDVASNEIVCSGLSMPHSPRWHNGTLYLLNAGTGEFGRVDLQTGQFIPIAFCPGFLRGLSFSGDYAVVGLSMQRKGSALSDLLLDENLAERGIQARCAVQVIDLKRGDVVHELRLGGAIEELFDTAIIPGARNCGSVGFISDEIRHTLFLRE